MRRGIIWLALVAALCAATVAQAMAAPSHAIAMHGDPALPADFQHLPYANPDAPKGGKVNYAWPGTFDSVNPFIVQGTAARGMVDLIFGDLVFDRLMMRSADEPFTMYPLLAKSVETDADRTFVEFTLDERARFSDGQPVTVDDVIFTIEMFREHGLPPYSIPAKKIAKLDKVGPNGIRMTFENPDRELPLILARLPILAKHAIDPATFAKSTLKPMVGSGPYVVSSVRPGESITFKRNPDYWARDIPSKRGFDNFDEVTLTYYRDENTLFEAFKKGLVDVLIDENSGRWANQYNFPAAVRGDVVKDTLETRVPPGMLGIVMNTRRPVFKNRELRAALGELFDFEWANRNLLAGAYTRTRSFFDNSELSSAGRPASEAEKKLLAAYPDSVTKPILEHGWEPPSSDGTGRDRAFLRVGFDRLKAAGYSIQNGAMIDPEGRPVTFEIMLNGNENLQTAMAWQQTLQKIGIQTSIRSVDTSQFVLRQKSYDFDAMFFMYTASLSPGVEQINRWGSATKDVPSFNFAGVADPVIDGLIQKFLSVRDRAEFVETVRAYDRVLMSGSYVVPLYYRPNQRVAHWKRIVRPDKIPITGAVLNSWWYSPDPAK